MIVLSKPAEPTPEVVKRFADATDREAGEVRNREGTAEETAVKQGVIGYLSEHWSSYDIPEPRVEKACGTADAPIEMWLDGEDAWDDILERVQRSLDRQLTDRVRIENV